MIAVAVSKWLEDTAKKSILNITENHEVRNIYNWIDHSVFCPSENAEREEFRKKYHLDYNTKYIISVSQEWTNGSIRLADAIKLSEKLPDGYRLILIGRLGDGVKLPDSIIHISYISTQKQLAVAYSISHAYVHFSIQDTFGLVIGEAMACGTIPITYNSTACAETPGGYGIVVKPRDIDGIIASLGMIEEKKKDVDAMIAYVKHNYDKITNTNEYVKLYENIISQ